MGIFVATAGASTSRLRRAAVINYNLPYTVCFSFYIPTASTWTNDFLWGTSGQSNSTSTSLGNRREHFGGSSGAFWKLSASDSAGSLQSVNMTTGPSADATWRRIGIKRSAVTTFGFRMWNGTAWISNSTNVSRDVTGREVVYAEQFFWDGLDSSSTGIGVCNYKAFNRALTDAEIEAELVTDTVMVTDGSCISRNPMSDTVTLTNNLTDVITGLNWSVGSQVIVGANDPGVTFSGGGAAFKAGCAQSPNRGAIVARLP